MWRAAVEPDFAFQGVRVHLGQAHGGPYESGAIRSVAEPVDVLMTEHPEHTALSKPFLRLPEDAARALYDALGEHFGGTSDVRQLRADLYAERQRVDRFIDFLTSRPNLVASWAGGAGPEATKPWASTARGEAA